MNITPVPYWIFVFRQIREQLTLHYFVQRILKFAKQANYDFQIELKKIKHKVDKIRTNLDIALS